MSKNVTMSLGKYILFSSLTLLIGAAVVGVPTLSQLKGLYDENQALQRELDSTKDKVNKLERLTELDDSLFSTKEAELNRVKKNANNLLYAITMSSGGNKPSVWEYETCEYGFETVPQCR